MSNITMSLLESQTYGMALAMGTMSFEIHLSGNNQAIPFSLPDAYLHGPWKPPQYPLLQESDYLILPTSGAGPQGSRDRLLALAECPSSLSMLSCCCISERFLFVKAVSRFTGSPLCVSVIH